MDSDGDRLAVYLLPCDALDVDDVFETVDGDDLAFTALEGATGDDYLVVFADGDGADLEPGVNMGVGGVSGFRGGYVVFLAKLLGEGGGHDDAADGGGGAEMRFPRFAAGGREGWVAITVSQS